MQYLKLAETFEINPVLINNEYFSCEKTNGSLKN